MTPNFKQCEHFIAEAGGICRIAKSLEELAPLVARGEMIQCCYMVPEAIRQYDCPNPKINPSCGENIIQTQEEIAENQDVLDQKIHSLTTIESSYVLDTITQILDEFRKEIQLIKEQVRQETKETVETLENRLSKIEKTIHSERRPEILFPNAEQDRPQPIQNKSRQAKQGKEFTNPTEAEKEFHDKIKSLSINQDILNEDFLKDLDLDEPF
jgi:hypothetical protein